MCHGAQVDQQPGVSPPQFDLGGIEPAEKDIRDCLFDGERAHPLHLLAKALSRPCPFVLGAAARPRIIHDSEPPKSPSGWSAMLTAPPVLAATPSIGIASTEVDRWQRSSGPRRSNPAT